jgi:O-antigen/teichoic acid export membrane protein
LYNAGVFLNSAHRNVLLSSFGGLGNQAVKVVQQLVWVPLFLSAFGPKTYGEWLTLFGLASFAALADVGIQVFWLNLLTTAWVSGRRAKYRRLFRAGILLFVVMSACAVGIAIILCVSGLLAKIAKSNALSEVAASVVFFLLVLALLANVLAALVRGVFRTVGNNPAVVRWEIIREAILLFAVALALAGGLTPLWIASLYVLISVAVLIWVVRSVRLQFPMLADFAACRSDARTLMLLIRGGSANLLGILANAGLIQGTLLMTNSMLSAPAVALVSTTRTLVNFARQAAGSVHAATLPEFSRLHSAADLHTMSTLLRRSAIITLFLAGSASLLLIAVGPAFFDVWTHHKFPDSRNVIALFAISVIVDALRMPLHDYLLGCNRIVLVSLSDAAYAAASLLTMWLALPKAGILAVPIATAAIGLVLHFPVLLLFVHRELGTGAKVIYSGTARGALTLATASVPVIAVCAIGAPWHIAAAIAGMSILLLCVLFWRFVVVREDKLSIGSFLARRSARAT